jgi:SAM-dependent methyltransferase
MAVGTRGSYDDLARRREAGALAARSRSRSRNTAGIQGGMRLAASPVMSIQVRAADEPIRDSWRIARALRSGALVDDRVFDAVFPLSARLRSSLYWTPVEVAVRAAGLLADRAGATILDIGSGVGKFCIVAGAAVHANVRGIEHRPHLVEIAREAAQRIGVGATFDGGTIEEQDASTIDGFYLYNPFAENLCAKSEYLDGTVELSTPRFRRDVEATVALLARARVGARVVTYCGFGGDLPDGFVLALRERCAGNRLELWVKQEPSG